MSYTDTKEGGRARLVTGGAVGALQVALAIAIVSGFGVVQFERKTEAPLASEFFPTTPQTPKPVEPVKLEPQPATAPESRVSAPEPLVRLPAPRPVEVAPFVPTLPIVTPAPLPTLAGPPVARSEPAPQFTPQAARPRGNVAQWVTTGDYPARELREGHEGLVRFRLEVDPRGRVQDCTVTLSSGYPALDAATCKYASRRARFEPASDEAGKAVTGSWSSAVRWVIPKD